MLEDGSPFLSSGASGFELTIFTGIGMTVFIADYFSLFLPDPVVMEFLSSWTEVGIFGLIILKMIRIEGWVFGMIGIGLFGDVNGDPIF